MLIALTLYVLLVCRSARSFVFHSCKLLKSRNRWKSPVCHVVSDIIETTTSTSAQDMSGFIEQFTSKNSSSTEVLRVQLMNAVRDMSTRTRAIKVLLTMNETLSVAECKTLLVAIIFLRSESLLESLLSLLKRQGMITSELLYVGIRTACRRRITNIAYSLLMEIPKDPKLTVDIDSVNSVLSLLSLQGRANDSWNILTLLYNQSFSGYLSADIHTYSKVAACASKVHNSDMIIKTFQLLQTENLTLKDETFFIDTLKYCSLTGFFQAAQQVLLCYIKLSKKVHPQAFSLLIMAYNVFRKDMDGKSNLDGNSQGGPSQRTIHQLDSILSHMKHVVMDEYYPELYNQVLQYYCLENKLDDAYLYFKSISQLHPTWSFSASTLLIYSSLIRKNKDPEKVNSLIQYMKSRNIESSFMLSKYESRKQLFAELTEAISIMKKYLSSKEYYKVRMEYVYYVVAQAVQERNFGAATSFFVDVLDTFQSAGNVSDVIVLGGCVELIMSRVPFRYSRSIVPPTLKVLATIDADMYSAHLAGRDMRAVNATASTLVVPEAYSRIRPNSISTPEVLGYRGFMNANYLILIDALLSEGQYDIVKTVVPHLSFSAADPLSELLLYEMLSAVVTNSINLSPLSVRGFDSVSQNSWSLCAGSILELVSSLRSTGYRPAEDVYRLIISRLCNSSPQLPYSPSLASYTGDEELQRPSANAPAVLDVDEVVCMVEEDGYASSLALQTEILGAYLSAMTTNVTDHRGIDYYRALASQCEAEGLEIDPKLTRMYDATMGKLAVLPERNYEEKESKVSLQSRLLNRRSSMGSSFQDNSTSSNLYSKVLETLLRAQRSQDAKSLLQLMLAKNITTKPEEIYVLMGHEIKANNAAGAVEIFTAFFHMPNSSAPDARSISLLAVALFRTKKFQLGAILAREILPHILSSRMALSVPVCESYLQFCLHAKDEVSATEFMLLIPPLQRKVIMLSSLSKLCAVSGQVDLLNKIKSDHSFPFEVICHYIAGFSLKGQWKKTFNNEYLLRKASSSRNLPIPPWVRTFLLYAAAIGGTWNHVIRLMEERECQHGELNYNLAVYAGLKHIYVMSKWELADSIKEKKISDILKLVMEMSEQKFRVHRSIISLCNLLLQESLGVDEIATELKSFTTCQNPVMSMDESKGIGGQLASLEPFTSKEIESLRLMDTCYLSLANLGKFK